MPIHCCLQFYLFTTFPVVNCSQVDPIVASFSGGAVGVISALMVVEINNVKQQEHKRCKYCLGTGMDVGISPIFLLLVCTFSLLFLISMIEMVILNYTHSLRADQNGAFSFEESPFEPTWIHSAKFRMHSQLLEAIMSLTLN